MTTTQAPTPAIPTERAQDQHLWDGYPHTVWDGVLVEDVRVADILAASLQVRGVAMAEHRGKPAVRLDLDSVLDGGKGRIVLTRGTALCDVKRYDGDSSDTAEYPSAREAAQGRYVNPQGDQLWVDIANRWAEATGQADVHEDVEERLFSLICDAVGAYTDMIGRPDNVAEVNTDRDRAYTLGAVVANVCPGWVVTDDTARLAYPNE